MYLAGLQDECQAAVTLVVSPCQPVTLHAVTDKVDHHDEDQQAGSPQGVAHPLRRVFLQVLGVEPLVLQGFKFVVGIEFGQFLVEQIEQLLVVRHELILAVRHVHGRQLQVVDQVAAHEPFQGEGVPHNLTFLLGAYLLDHLAEVFSGDGIVAPSVVEHQVIAH